MLATLVFAHLVLLQFCAELLVVFIPLIIVANQYGVDLNVTLFSCICLEVAYIYFRYLRRTSF